MPLKLDKSIFLSFATAISRLSNIIAVEFIVIEIDIFSIGISFNNNLISSRDEIGTPTLPTSPSESS